MMTQNNQASSAPEPRLSISVADILAEGDRLYEQCTEDTDNKGLFTLKTATRWMELAQTRPIPKMLFGEFWFEGELCILFADTNLGKSILAVQIGNSISRGEAIQGFKLETEKQPILYFDFELTDKQFENRYSIDFAHHYNFDNNFIRVEINPDAEVPDGLSFEDFLSHSLERSIAETEARVLIIDNLTYLKNETEKAKDALPLMKQLKALKNKYGLSILALAHTPKRDLTKPITRNDLQGSKMLMNFCDSSFSIGESNTDKNLRYLKQIKQRSTEQIYDADNVCVCEVIKPGNFLRFELTGHSSEWQHLKQQTEKEKDERVQEAITLNKQGVSNREIARRFNVSEGTVRNWFRSLNQTAATEQCA
jgi:RecA-family ATPase